MWKILAYMLLALVMSGCAGQQEKLLEKDYPRMSNDDLITYYDNLSAELARCEGDRDRASVGVGTGTGIGSHVGIFLGLSRGISTCDPVKLRQRKSEVMGEMKRRGLERSTRAPE